MVFRELILQSLKIPIGHLVDITIHQAVELEL